MGGADFELLCTGAVRNYSANPADIAGQTEVKPIKQKLIAQVEDTVRELELQSDRTIAKIYIGKTFIKRRKKPRGRGFQKFNPLRHHTWKKNGISSRWHDHRQQEYGRDGLVVLGAITRETMPEKCRESGQIDQEDFTLAMEQKLLHHYLLSHPDPRVVNESFSTGQLTKERSYAYAVYMAFRYEGEPSSSTMCQYSESGTSHTPPSPTISPPPPSSTISPPPRKKGKRRSSVQQTQPALSTQNAVPLTTAHSNQQQATGRGAGVQQPSPTTSQDTTPGTPTRHLASTSPATRLYQPPQTPEATDPSPRNTQPEEAQQSTRPSTRRSVRFDETQMPKRLRRATRSRSIVIDLT